MHAALEVVGLPDFRLLMQALGVTETAAGIEETAEAIIRARNKGALLDLLRAHGIRPGALLRGKPVGQLSLMAQKDIARSLVENVVFMRRFERAMGADLKGLVRKGLQEATRIMQQDFPNLTRLQRERTQALLDRLNTMMEGKYREVYNVAQTQLDLFAEYAGRSAERVVQIALADVGKVEMATTRLTGPQLREIVRYPIQGLRLGEWWERQGQVVSSALRQQVQIGLMFGESVPDLTKRILGVQQGRLGATVQQIGERGIEAIVRTTVNAVNTNARLEALREFDSDVTDSYQYVATLDERTTILCASLDGNIYRYDEVNAPHPPLHINCRSTIVPIVNWAQLGVEPPEKLAPLTRATKAGPVEFKTYEQWLRDQPDYIQDRILGIDRAAMWRGGFVSFRDLLDKDYKILSVEELRQHVRELGDVKQRLPLSQARRHIDSLVWEAGANLPEKSPYGHGPALGTGDQFRHEVNRVLDTYTPEQLDRLQRSVNNITFYGNTDDMTSFATTKDPRIPAGSVVSGATHWHDAAFPGGPIGPAGSDVHLAFGEDYGGPKGGGKTASTVAHEFGHVMEYVPAHHVTEDEFAEEFFNRMGFRSVSGGMNLKDQEIVDAANHLLRSDSGENYTLDMLKNRLPMAGWITDYHITQMPAWLDASEKEIHMGGFGVVVPSLSSYAASHPSEAWAEFSRLMFEDPTRAQNDFPLCYNVWKQVLEKLP